MEGVDDLAGDLVGLEHHGIVEIVIEQIGIDKAGTDVGEADFQASGIGLLLQCLEIDVLEGLGGRIGRRGSQAFGARNAGDGCDVALTSLGEIAVSLPYHACKTHAVGVDGVEFDVGRERAVLLADAR